MIKRIRETLHKYRKWEPLVFFTAGFTFDALLLHRIDNPLMLTHQAIYLCFAALIIAWDLLVEEGHDVLPKWAWFGKAWFYREAALHFILGTLLNVYTIFYFKSGSLMSSFSFLIFLALLLFLNEARPVRISKHLLRNALFGLCLISYMNIVVSIAIGSVGPWVFLLAIGVAFLIHNTFVNLLRSRLPASRRFKEIRLPFYGVAAIYVFLYAFKILPPVPLSVKFIGIYHDVGKDNGDYRLGFYGPSWQFWGNGETHFEAQPGDKIVCFAQVFSPTRFKDQLYVRWQHKDAKSQWQSWDAIPFDIAGGREEGYRGYTIKTNYEPGEWRVSIETLDGREVGRVDFDVIAKETEARVMKYDYR
ncbi:MAG: DUF2914 domain-containing protein [Bdellovibrionota bacterium]